MKRPTLPPALPALLLLALLAGACADEESRLGVNLVDNNTLYDGQSVTFTADRALSVRDDSLLTTNYTYGIIGNWTDATFGSVSATLYTQIALDDNTGTINLAENIIDSVMLSLVLVPSQTFPDTDATYLFHFEVMQLAEAIETGSLYYATDALPVDASHTYFNADVTVSPTDTVVSLKLDNSISEVLNQSASAEEFAANTKGLRIRITGDADDGMVTINFAAINTCLQVHHRYLETDTSDNIYTFLLGTGTTHFTHFEHDYSASVTGGVDSLDGTTALYLEPLGGYNILVSFDAAVRNFTEAHPKATVHYAELLLPVQSYMGQQRPDRVLALAKVDGGSDTYINDLLDSYTLSGFDGKYDADRNCYRMRVTQHVQGMLRNGGDPGTLLVLNSRRSFAARTIIDGLASANPVRIEIVYSE